MDHHNFKKRDIELIQKRADSMQASFIELGMLVIQDQVWNRVTVNRAAGKTTRYYCDEFHLLLKGELASWSVEIWKRFRKWGGIPTGITPKYQGPAGLPRD